MNISSSLRSSAIALIPALLITAAKAQQSTVRVKVKADLNAPPDRELGLAKTVYGDAGSFIALKTLFVRRCCREPPAMCIASFPAAMP